jgi:hypothetical protein
MPRATAGACSLGVEFGMLGRDDESDPEKNGISGLQGHQGYDEAMRR